MIAADTSSLVAYFAGEEAQDTFIIDQAIQDGILVLPPPVLSELLSDPKLPKSIELALKKIPLISEQNGFWERVGKNRSLFLAKGKKARLADSLIAQFCIDHNIPLVTRDRDFEKYQLIKLKLI